MTLKFKPEDCNFPTVMSPIAVAQTAQAKHDKWLKEQTVVYSLGKCVTWYSSNNLLTHQAYLVDIKEIEKQCEHKRVYSENNFGRKPVEYYCLDCTANLKTPTGWEVVE